MTSRIRMFVALTRPAVVMLLALFAMTGLAEAGHAEDRMLVARVLVVVIGFLITSVVVNDLADEAIDRVNLPNDASRPLVVGSTGRREFIAVAVTAGAVAITSAATLGLPVLAVVIAGLALSLGYSLRPLRLADRGAVASMLLPAGYVAVPYLVGTFAAHHALSARDYVLLAGLYVGFIGRILLKDFRDVRGDALFGKRTFLVRYGRATTCKVSAVCWVLGATALAGVRDLNVAVIASFVVHVGVGLGLLRALADERGVRRDERLISAIAIVGRSMVLTLVVHLSFTNAQPYAMRVGVVLALAAMMAQQAATMARRGPRTQLTVPAEWAALDEAPVRASVSS